MMNVEQEIVFKYKLNEVDFDNVRVFVKNHPGYGIKSPLVFYGKN